MAKRKNKDDIVVKILIGVTIFVVMALIFAAIIIMVVTSFQQGANHITGTPTETTYYTSEDNFVEGTIEISDNELEEYNSEIVFG